MTAALRRHVRAHAPESLSRPARDLLEQLALAARDDGTFGDGEFAGSYSDERLVKMLPQWSERSIRRARAELLAAACIELGVYRRRDGALRPTGLGRRSHQYRVLLVPTVVDEPVQPTLEEAEQPAVAAGAEDIREWPQWPLRAANLATQSGQVGHSQPPTTPRIARARARAHPSGTPSPTGSDKNPPASASLPPLPQRPRRRPRETILGGRRRELAEALRAARLDQSCGTLDADAWRIVDAAIDRAGIPAMVRAAQRAHRPNDPARSWWAWVELWGGLQPPPPKPPRAAPEAPRSDDPPPPAAVPLERVLAIDCRHPGCPGTAGQPCRDRNGEPRDPHRARTAAAAAGDGP